MLPPFTSKDQYLQLMTSNFHQGENRENVRELWIPATQFEQINSFANVDDSFVKGEWISDIDPSLPAEIQELRIFCIKGKARLEFYGTNIVLRLGLNPTWGKADVRIDGMVPSAIPGLVVARDVVSCASEDYVGQPCAIYYDVTIADGLPDGKHTIELYCDNFSDGKCGFFICSGAKVASFNNNSLSRDLWIHKPEDNNGLLYGGEDLSLINRSGYDVFDVSLNFYNLVDAQGNPIPAKAIPSIPSGNSIDDELTSLTCKRTGYEQESLVSSFIDISALYHDPTGNVDITEQVLISVNSPSLKFVGAWYKDTFNSENRAFTNDYNSYAFFQTEGDTFIIRVQRDYGWGDFRIVKNRATKSGCTLASGSNIITVPDTSGLSAGKHIAPLAGYYYDPAIPNNATITEIIDETHIRISTTCKYSSTSASIAFFDRIAVVSCHDEQGGGFYVDVTVSGCGNGLNEIRIEQNEYDEKWVSFSGVKTLTTIKYSRVIETITINWHLRQMLPQPIKDASLQEGEITWSPIDSGYFDIPSGIDNRNLEQYRVYHRFPTYCVVYKSGHFKNLRGYDVVVVDPLGISRSEVAALQALGIIVLVYVSFGEEDGTLDNIWDHTSKQGPWVGDGTGPGGYAGYYMKGGYGYGEQSECKHDNQRYSGAKTCAKASATYWSEPGRCSKVCTKDWREGYLSFADGGPCSGGHTASDYWQRDASVACANESCPDYTPVHGGCPYYEQTQDAWGQDFSILTTDYPDENGIWSSYYIDAVKRGPGSWYERIRDYYLPLVFGTQTERSETHTVATNLDQNGQPVLGVVVNYPPIDLVDNVFSVQYQNSGGFEYIRGRDYSFDEKLGTITLTPSSEGAPLLAEGDSVFVTYVQKALNADGVFMDTVDTVDVYPAPEYQQGMIDLINDMKATYPERIFCSNRGFSILPGIITSCSYVMFESFLCDYDWLEDKYSKITNQASIDYNNEVIRQLCELRRKHTFDVLALNYCAEGPRGDELREYIRQESHKHGFMSWSSTILLGNLPENAKYRLSSGPIRGSIWRQAYVKRA